MISEIKYVDSNLKVSVQTRNKLSAEEIKSILTLIKEISKEVKENK
jgi:hypothetical protein